MSSSDTLPLPAEEMRALVGPTDPAAFDNPDGSLVYPYIEQDAYKQVFDFGCGCGRVARQLIMQKSQVQQYVGIDIHRGMIEWCNQNLVQHARQFQFLHHDVFNCGLNPGVEKPWTLPFPVDDSSFSMVNALSVFTHLPQAQSEYYLSEVSRILRPDGVFHSSWFLFDREDFGLMQFFPQKHCLYVDYEDPSQAVLYEKDWVRETASKAGLKIISVMQPGVRGYQWTVLMAPRTTDFEEVGFPLDEAPIDSIDR